MNLISSPTRLILAALMCAGLVSASGQTTPPPTAAPPPAAPAQRSAADLEKLVAPIALYSDPLIATILPASVYPLEIVQAARFVKDTNNLAKLDGQPWDDNVKAVARIPALIEKMNDDLSWTVDLGKAFLDQDKDVMDAIQAMRLKANKAGTLQTSQQQIVIVTNMVVERTVETKVVVVTNTVVQIQPSNPQVVYVPTYNPYTVYYPPPGYVYNPYAPLVTFGVGIAVGAIIANNCNWYHGCVWHGGYHGDVDIDINRNVNINNKNINNKNINAGNRPGASASNTKWQPDQNRLRSSGAAGTSASTMESRGWGASAGAAKPTGTWGGGAPSTGAVGTRPGAGTAATRPTTGAVGARPTTGNVGARPATTSTFTPPGSGAGGAAASRPAQTPTVNRPSPTQTSAFGGMNNGAADRSYSSRGAASRGGGGMARGGGGRGGRR